jgi:hypothetical protein
MYVFSTSEFRLTVLPFNSSVILVTDNVTKAAQVGIQMELTKHIGTEMLLVNFQACSVLSIEILSQAVACTLLLQDLLKAQSLYRLVLITALHGQTIQDLFTSPRCDIPTVTTRFRMQSVNAPLVYSNEIEFIRQLRPISCYGLTQVTNASFKSCLGTPYTTQSETITITLKFG